MGESTWLRYPVALVVVCHGLTYVLFPFFAPGVIAQRYGRAGSPVLRRVLTDRWLERVVLVLHVAAGAALLVGGGAIALAGWPSLEWVPWRPAAVAGSAVGLAAFAVFWDGRGRRLVEEGGIGAAISAVLLVGAAAFPVAFPVAFPAALG